MYKTVLHLLILSGSLFCQTAPGYEEPNYDKILKGIVSEGRKAVKHFSPLPENRKVYAFCYDLDERGFRISWNSEGAFAKTAEKYRKEWKTPESEWYGVHGLKFNSGDFSFHWDLFNKETSPIDTYIYEVAEKQYDNLYEAPDSLQEEIALHNREANLKIRQLFVQAIDSLKNDFTQFDRSPDFIAYVTLHDATSEELSALMKETVSDKLFNRVVNNNKNSDRGSK